MFYDKNMKKSGIISLDGFDLKILATLQNEGRLSMVELADQVALSPTACQRRIKRLEEKGIIVRFTALLDPGRLGFEVEVFITVRIERQAKEAADAFRTAVRALPDVRACYLLSGDVDFLLHVFAPDLKSFTDFAMNRILSLPGIKDVRSSIVLERVKVDDPLLPLDDLMVSD